MGDWMTVPELAAYLGISRHTVYRMVHERRVPFNKAPGSSLLRFRRSRIDDWLSSGEVQTATEYLKGDDHAKTAPPARPRRTVRG